MMLPDVLSASRDNKHLKHYNIVSMREAVELML